MTTLGSIQYANQFRQSSVRGQTDELLNFNIITAKLNNTIPTQITSAGDLVKYVSGATGVPTIAEVEATETANLNTLYGFVIKDLKNTQYTNGLTMGVAGDGVVMQMIAEAPIASGERVAYDATITTPANTGKVLTNPTTATAGQIPCGFALDTASASGDLIRVLIKF